MTPVHPILHFILAAILCLASAAPARAQTGPAGPPPPSAPDTISRDPSGRATVRAVRITAPLRLDGRLDEEVYTTTPGAGGFLQQLPREGAEATEPTSIWIFFDDDTLYVSAHCVDSQPDRIVADELRRDNRNMFTFNDSVSVVLDTFHDRRNGFFFQTNALGAVRDQEIRDGAQLESWNTVWDVKSVRTADGYTLEMAIPFKSLRYRAAGPQVWGLNVRRVVRSKNETSTLALVPASYGVGGISQMNVAATLVGVETPARSMNLEFKPYAVSALTTDLAARVPFRNDIASDVGLDMKYGVTRGLTADVTVNTDFAQVEEDLQQVNLTRFNLFFPEKRDFFLQGQGIFDFGGRNSQRAGSGGVPIMFFSRRIGLSGGQAVPVLAGGRLTGKAGRFDVGALTIRTDDHPSAGATATTFSALRLRRDVLRRSSVGMIATGRWPSASGAGDNAVFGVDSELRFYDNVQATAYWARTVSPALAGEDASYRGQFAYGGDRYGFSVDHVLVGANFNPEVGFVNRTDFARTALTTRFSPRMRRSRLVRRLAWQAELEYITDAGHDVVEDRGLSGVFGLEFNSSDEITVTATRQYERIPAAFTIAPGVVVPAGGYAYRTVEASYSLAQQRKVSGTVTASHGSFYDGTRTTAAYSGRIGMNAHVAVEPTLTLNWVDLPQGHFTARLVGARVIVAPTARLGFSGLTQFNPSARTLTSSVRLRWEYIPGSELFVVYSDGRDTGTNRFPGLQNRTFAVKATRLFRL